MSQQPSEAEIQSRIVKHARVVLDITGRLGNDLPMRAAVYDLQDADATLEAFDELASEDPGQATNVLLSGMSILFHGYQMHSAKAELARLRNKKISDILMTPDFAKISDQDLLALSNEAIDEFHNACRLANQDDRLRRNMMSLINGLDAGESFDRLCDEDPDLADELLNLGLAAMTSSRMILLAQRELMRRGIVPTPTDF